MPSFRIGSWTLVVIAVTASAFAWYEHRSRATAVAAAERNAREQRAALEQRLAVAEQRARELETRLTATREQVDRATSKADEVSRSAEDDPGQLSRAGGEGYRGEMMAMMDNPEFARLFVMQQRGQLDSRYRALFKKLNLSPAELERFKDFLMEKQTVFRDVLGAARAQGLDPRQDRAQVRELVGQANAELDAAMQATLGPERFAEYQRYEATMPQRTLVDQLSNRLSYTPNPLDPAQAEQLIDVLGGNASVPRAGGGRRGNAVRPARITDQTVSQASAVLSPAQLTALKQLQQEQQARSQLMDLYQARDRATPAPAPRPGG